MEGLFTTVFKNRYEWNTDQGYYSRGRTIKKKKKLKQNSADLWVVPILVSFAYYIIVQTTIAGEIASVALFPFLVIRALNIFWAAPWKQREWMFLMNFTCNGCLIWMIYKQNQEKTELKWVWWEISNICQFHDRGSIILGILKTNWQQR